MGYLDLAKRVSIGQMVLRAHSAGTAGARTPNSQQRERSELSERTARELLQWKLTPDQLEAWEERVCIMHFDGHVPLKQAEALALIDLAPPVLHSARKLPMCWYAEWVELVLAIRSEGVPLQNAEARAYAAILARMRWPA